MPTDAQSEVVSLGQASIIYYVHQGVTNELDDLDSETATICRALGMFFSVNSDLANHITEIEKITLTLNPDREIPPQANVKLKHGRNVYRLTTNEGGAINPDWKKSQRRRPKSTRGKR